MDQRTFPSPSPSASAAHLGRTAATLFRADLVLRLILRVAQAKMEISKEESFNPIKQDIKKVRRPSPNRAIRKVGASSHLSITLADRVPILPVLLGQAPIRPKLLPPPRLHLELRSVALVQTDAASLALSSG